MNSSVMIRMTLAGAAGLAIAVGYALSRRASLPPLPAAAHHPNLPAAFDRALRATRDLVRAHGNNAGDVRRLAHLYEANGLTAEARACYRIIAAMPRGLSAHDHYYLADLAQQEGSQDSAMTELRAVLAAEPRYLPARVALAAVLAKSGRDDEAAKEYAAVLAIEANHPQASVGLARIELARKEDDSAVARLEDLLAAHPESASGAALLADMLKRRGETDRATALDQLAQETPEPIPADPWRAELLGDIYDVQRLAQKYEERFKSGPIGQAMPFLLRIEEIDPQSYLPQFLRGWSAARRHQDHDAVTQFRLALAKGGDPEKICPELVHSLLALGNVSEAASLMAGYHAKMPDSIIIATAYADVAIRSGDQNLARTLLTGVLQKAPDLPAQNLSLAKILWDSGERDAASARLLRIARADPTDVASRALLGEYYLGKADPFSAIKPLEQANEQVPAKTPVQKSLAALLGAAYVQAGDADRQQGRWAEAVDYYDKATRINPADLAGYAGKAKACVQLGRLRPAEEALQALAALDPGNPTIYLSLGDVLYQEGEAEQARRQWQKARPLVARDDNDLRDALDLRLSGRVTPGKLP